MKFKIILALFLSILICGCSETQLSLKDSRLFMGTVVNITVNAASDAEAKKAIKNVFNEIKRVENLLSKYKIDSDIFRINISAKKTGPIKINSETLEIIKKSIEFSRMSDGAFDITVAPLIDFWKGDIPGELEIQDVLRCVGFEKVVLDEEKDTVAFLGEGMKIDLGAIAKGYAVDKAIEVLKRDGINNAIIEAGGDIYCLGRKSISKPWTVGVQHPRAKKKIVSKLKLQDKAVATSGDYERFFVVEGQRYSHIIDPRTGYPIKENPVSVTVIADSCMSADALATAVFVLGSEDGLRLLNKFEGCEAIIISGLDHGKGYKVDLTDGLKGEMKFKF